jgi:hypothetical protein
MRSTVALVGAEGLEPTNLTDVNRVSKKNALHTRITSN